MSIDLTYPAIVDLIGGQGMTVQEQSRQLLVWFLLNCYRLDDTEAIDSVCDKPDDKGIDGIYVNDDLGEIHVLSSVLRVKAPARTLGDGDLKDLQGTLAQLQTGDGVRQLIDTTQNQELKALLINKDIAEKIDSKYSVRGVLVSNGERDQNTIEYLQLVPNIELFDKGRLVSEYVPIDQVTSIAGPITFDIRGVDRIMHAIEGDFVMAIVALPARELLRMEGIVNEELFAPNVRQWLGNNTNVNRALGASIDKAEEHKLFPAFHNGMTVLCETFKIDLNEITISGYGVVNGCQSLRGFYEKQDALTSDLKILVKFINEAPGTALAAKITDHTNNQNGISPRDLKANHPIQKRLQTEINNGYNDQVYFRIKRGEHSEWPKDKIIENLLAGRILLAFDEKHPEASHQSYKVFEDLYSEIFGKPRVTGDRIVVLHNIYQDVLTKTALLDDTLIANYSLTSFVVLDLVRAILEMDAKGREFIANPSEFINVPSGWNRIRIAIGEVTTAIFRLFNAEMNRQKGGENFFDYKRNFKSPKFIRDMRETIKSHYQITVDSQINLFQSCGIIPRMRNMKQKPLEMKDDGKDLERFKSMLKMVVNVPKEEVKKYEEQQKKKAKKKS
jgi:hypothetical protein